MRELKFRAWIPEKKEIIYKGFIIVDSKVYTVSRDEKNECDLISQKPIKEGVFMQFVGLKDKNGKEIYEGDILGRKGYTFKKIVQWWNGGFIVLDDLLEKHQNGWWNTPWLVGWLDDIEIIGNIYENPELLT